MLEFSYFALSTFILLLLLFGNYKLVNLARNSGTGKTYKTPNIAGIIVLWLLYLSALSFSGLLKDYSLPPRFPLLVFLPFAFWTTLFYIRNKNNPIFERLPLQWTTFFQSFRIAVELLLLFTYYKGIIPVEATFEGYNFDILMGISAVLIGFVFANKVARYKRLLVFWNGIGILMVLIVAFIVGTSVYKSELWGYDRPTVSTAFFSLPYLLIPGFLAPAAIFVHVVSFLQIRQKAN
ncbi:MAG TPA: hypothetical protein PKA00_15815 [Saprospiraceae bacterium]|nr:hypothetical protein [Saprospiraceae bacterium]HMQ84381.1 hypothetical protein [Saprospiraceae bacterium]